MFLTYEVNFGTVSHQMTELSTTKIRNDDIYYVYECSWFDARILPIQKISTLKNILILYFPVTKRICKCTHMPNIVLLYNIKVLISGVYIQLACCMIDKK